MKRKGITIWEQHVERFVLGAAVLFFLGFTAVQFLRQPNAVEGPGGTIRPGEIDAMLSAKAAELDERLADDAEAAIDVPDPAPVLDAFAASLAGSISPAETIAASDHRVELIKGFGGSVAGVTYLEPEVPAPRNVMVERHFDALTDETLVVYPELKERFPQPPYDVVWANPAAIFSLADAAAEYARRGPDGQEPVPANWYGNRLDILDVRVEREELVDGAWKNLKTLDILPGRQSFRPRLTDDVDKSTRDEILASLAQPGAQRSILQPGFYPIKNASWSPPDPRDEPEETEIAGLTAEQQAIRRAERELARAVRSRSTMLGQLEELGGTMDPDDPGGGPAGGGAAGGGAGGRGAPGGGLGAGAGGMGRRGAGTSAEDKRQIETLKSRIRRLNRSIARLTQKLQDLTGEEVAAAPEPAATSGDLMSGDEIVIWAHDIWVEPGATYRYRFTVDLYNPFFARKLSLVEGQHGLADRITLSSRTSDWSAPRRITRPTRVFVTSARGAAQGGGRLGLGQASAEVYRFYDGRWWLQKFPVEPGDRIGKVSTPRSEAAGDVPIDFGTDWFVLDIIDDIDADRPDADRGWGATVLLQSIVEPGRTVLLHPRQQSGDGERAELEEAVELAELGGDVAQVPPG